MVKTYWGVDSSITVTKDLYNCVLQNFGKPLYWGRYLTTVPEDSEGLTREEIQLIRSGGTRILPIYNNFTSSTGYRSGITSAVDAVSSARRLGFPKGVPIFANVARSVDVDASWIRGWYEGIQPRGYVAGYCHDPSEGGFAAAYCAAAIANERIPADTILWSAEPLTGATKARNAPAYRPKTLSCKANVWVWQYGRDSRNCRIDTNLASRSLYDILW